MTVGLLDRYRQFEGMTHEEVSAELQAQAAERRRQALARVDPIDLSTTTWHEPPHPHVVAAITHTARGAINRAVDPAAPALRSELSQRLGVEPERLAFGHGAGGLIETAVRILVDAGTELVTSWPSYPLPALAARSVGGRVVAVDGGTPERLLAAITPSTRVLFLCNPNDPTGAHLDGDELRSLLAAVPEHVTVMIDEALIDFVRDERAPSVTLELLDGAPRAIAFRTLSKVYGLAALRVGWAIGSPGSEPLLRAIEPAGGLGALQQSGALEAIKDCGPQVRARRATVIEQREALLRALPALGVDAPPGEANVLWLASAGMTADTLSNGLARAGVLVASGRGFGDEHHVRVTIRDARATSRLLGALERVLDRRV